MHRYFACESFYNIAKVCKGEILMYFNEIFDALSKVGRAVAKEKGKDEAMLTRFSAAAGRRLGVIGEEWRRTTG